MPVMSGNPISVSKSEFARRKPRGVALFLVLVFGSLVFGANRARALTITIDEFQNDTVSLPFAPQQGTLFLCESSASPITCEAVPSDVILFLPGTGTGTALMQSDVSESDGSDAPGDRVLLIPYLAPFFSIPEPGAEGTTQTVLYTPVPGQPGFAFVGGMPVSYSITSDSVPEPATWLMIATFLAATCCWRCWSHQDTPPRKKIVPVKHRVC